MSPRLTLDQQSFEQLLSAASFIQQLNQQCLHPSAFDESNASLLSALVETQQAIETGALDMEGATDRVVHLAVRLTGAQSSVTWIFTEHGFVYRAGAGSGAADERVRLEVLSRLAALDDVRNGPPVDLSPLWNSASDPLPSAAAKSLLIAPIFHGQRIAGGLAVFSAEPDAFTEQDRTSTRLLAGLLAHALGKSTESHLHRTVSFERATVLQAIDQLIMSLTKLTPSASAQDCVPQRQLETSPGPVAELALQIQKARDEGRHPDPVVPPEIYDEIFRTAESGIADEFGSWAGAAGSDGPPLWPGQDEPSPDALAPELVITAAHESERTMPLLPAPTAEAAPALPFDVRPPRGQPKRASAWRVATDECCRRSLELTGASRQFLSRVPSHVRASCSAVTNFVAGHWQTGRDELSAALKRVAKVFRYASSFTVRIRIPASPKGYYPVGLAGAGTGLLVMALFLVLTTGMARSPEVVSASPSTQTQKSEIHAASGTTQIAKDRQDRPLAVAASRQHPASPEPSANMLLPSSHMQVTDRNTESALRSLSPFEIPALRRRAGYGDDNAAFLLGMAYESGHGVRRSCVKAVEWVAKSANQGNPAAQFNLALRYRIGDGVPANPQESEKWLKKAAARKYSEAGLTNPPHAPANHPM